MSTERMQQLSSEMRGLNAELESLQARALNLVEELENDFDVAELPSEVQVMFLTMQRLITKV
ncbi:MAG: hypothetical protein WBV55_09990 [Candidatus Sulfotelmatobacter sp.]